MWAQNAAAVRGFIAVDTQWRIVALPSGGAKMTGLDYAGARAGLEMRGIEVTPELWVEIQIVEGGALAAMREA